MKFHPFCSSSFKLKQFIFKFVPHTVKFTIQNTNEKKKLFAFLLFLLNVISLDIFGENVIFHY